MREDSTGSPSSELMLDLIISLDGYASADGWPGWWGLEGPEYLSWLQQDAAGAYTALMGANTYQQFSGFAAHLEDSTAEFTSEEAASVAQLAAMTKVVFSSTLEEPLALPNTQLVSDDAVEAIAKMKRTGTANLRTIGSLSLGRSLLKAGLVDRYRLVVFPVITGATGSERIFDGYPDVALTLSDSRTFDGRSQLLEYVPTVLSDPPLQQA